MEEKLLKIVTYVAVWLQDIGITFIIGGLVGGVIQRFRKIMTWRKFISTLVLAGFVGWVSGHLLTQYFDLPIQVVTAICSTIGVFAENILKEIEGLISNASEWFKKWLNKKVDNDV